MESKKGFVFVAHVETSETLRRRDVGALRENPGEKSREHI